MRFRWTTRWSMILLAVMLLVPLSVSAAPPKPVLARVDPALLRAGSNAEMTFWVVMRQKADLSDAYGIKDWTERGEFVVEQLRITANTSQAALQTELASKGKKFQSFWIVNALKVTGDGTMVQDLATRADVAEIISDVPIKLPVDLPGKVEPTVNAVEWGLNSIRAPLVWSTYGVHGEGIVVANIDTGVRYNHPAVVNQYRGNLGGGNFNHNYNWFDPASACASPSLVPCDNNGHGSHTMGTMVGDDGAGNQIGVAPAAKWIAAKGCESSSCSTASLLASGQWVLAPTDLNNQNPRADLRPNIVNNSWGSTNASDTFYQATVQAWVASGIFPSFSNGNSGPSCGTVGSPGSYPESYGVGAYDSSNAIASFSSRGAAPAAVGGQTKPDIAAPGVNIRSSWNDGAYNSISGTSMASPHLAGTVALMWSAAPSLVGDIAQTRALLDMTAIDTSDLTCGGTAADNNVWGEGRLDAFAAVDQSPRGPTGHLVGTVMDSSSAPIVGASVHAMGPSDRMTVTDAAGHYSFRLPIGSYDVSAGAFGYVTQNATGLTVSDSMTTTHDFTLAAASSYPVTGYVRDIFLQPIANASVTIQGTPIPGTTTDANGFYSFASVPEGTYSVQASAGRCTNSQTQDLTVNSPETLDFALTQRSDSFGYYCQVEPINFISANTVLALTGDDVATQVSLPFAFPFYGQSYTSAWVTTNGFMNFLASSTALSNGAIPSTAAPNGAIYPFWDDMYVDASASVRTELVGTAPTRQFVIEWRNIRFYSDTAKRVTFEVVLHENGHILVQYMDIANDPREQGNSTTIGIENQNGTVALQYSNNEAALTDNLAVRYRLAPRGFSIGTVTDANDNQAISGATVRAIQGATEIRRTTTDASGNYSLLLPLGDYTIEAAATNYITETAVISLPVEDGSVTHNFSLRTPRAEVSPSAMTILLPAGQMRHRTLTINNTGSASMDWSIVENPDTAWVSENPSSGTLAMGGTQSVDIMIDTTGLTPGVYDTTLQVRSNSGRQPSLPVTIHLVVPAYLKAVNAGGAAFTDAAGEPWSADQAYTANSGWGYLYKGKPISTAHAIDLTTDDVLYQSARRGLTEYRFDGLPAGTYQVELRFADIQGVAASNRVFDVAAENQPLLLGFDISSEVGIYAADEKTFFITVTDGQLNLRFLPRRGYNEPLINAIRVTQRPDR